MHLRARLVLPLAAVLFALCAPAGASAALSGQVFANPQPDGARLRIPVFLDNASVRANKLKSPVVTLLVTRTLKVTAPKGRKMTVRTLVWGDAITATAKVTKGARGSVFPTISANGMKLRGRASSATDGALQDKIDALQAQLNKLQAYVGQLASYTISQIQSLRADLASLRADLTALKGTVTSLTSQLGTLKTQLANLNIPPNLTTQVTAITNQLSTLTTTVTGLATQLPVLTGGLATVTSNLATVTGKLDGISPGDLTNALNAIGALQSLTNGLNVSDLNNQLATITSHLGTVGGTDLQTQLTTLAGQLTGLNSTVTTAVGRLNVVCSPTANILSNSVLGTLLGTTHFPGC